MTSTYGDITVGSVWDGDIVTAREVVAPAAGTHAELIRLTTRTGGRRTEAADFPLDSLSGLRIAEPLLLDVPDDQLAIGADGFADNVRMGYREQLDSLHAIALEMERRKAVTCIERGCGRGGWRCQCHRFNRWK